LHTQSNGTRAVMTTPGEDVAEIQFYYNGNVASPDTLGSGEARNQLGLKLRAQDPCNLVYVMWRLAPENNVVVSVKRNANASQSDACENNGYTNIAPQKSGPVPAVARNSNHL